MTSFGPSWRLHPHSLSLYLVWDSQGPGPTPEHPFSVPAFIPIRRLFWLSTSQGRIWFAHAASWHIALVRAVLGLGGRLALRLGGVVELVEGVAGGLLGEGLRAGWRRVPSATPRTEPESGKCGQP